MVPWDSNPLPHLLTPVVPITRVTLLLQSLGPRWLGNIYRMNMSLERNSFILNLPRNLTQIFLRCGVPIWARLSYPRHETSWNHQHAIHHVVGFIQIPRTQWVGIYTLCYRIMKYPCLSYEFKENILFLIWRIQFVFKETTLMESWQAASILLSLTLPYL